MGIPPCYTVPPILIWKTAAYEVQVTAISLDPKDTGPGKEKEKLVSRKKLPASPSYKAAQGSLAKLSQLKQSKPKSPSQTHAKGKSKPDKKA